MKQKFIQVGTIGIRNPADRYEIMKSVPIYEEVTPEITEAQAAVHKDIAKVFAEKMKQYIDGGGIIETRSGK